jgi:hypothetical protein
MPNDKINITYKNASNLIEKCKYFIKLRVPQGQLKKIAGYNAKINFEALPVRSSERTIHLQQCTNLHTKCDKVSEIQLAFWEAHERWGPMP